MTKQGGGHRASVECMTPKAKSAKAISAKANRADSEYHYQKAIIDPMDSDQPPSNIVLPLKIFIGCDTRERQSALVLQQSLQRLSSLPLSICLLEKHQLHAAGLDWRARDPLQSTDFSFNRFLVPYLLGFKGWGLYLDGDMLCLSDPAALWSHCKHEHALLCVQHPEHLWGQQKMNGLPQTSYPRKNWSSLMLFQAERCRALTPEFVNTASGLTLHRFAWLEQPGQLGRLPRSWNHLVGVDRQPQPTDPQPDLVHWTLGGPWLPGYGQSGGHLADLWRQERAAMTTPMAEGL
jgi:lipopolysaccharide biosynthesis glycosyltransferase